MAILFGIKLALIVVIISLVANDYSCAIVEDSISRSSSGSSSTSLRSRILKRDATGSSETVAHETTTTTPPPQYYGMRLPSNLWKPLKKSKYLSYLFRKYGSGGLITFEGLEHLMHNLDLGGLEFNPGHTVEEHHPNGYAEEEERDDEQVEQVVVISTATDDDDDNNDKVNGGDLRSSSPMTKELIKIKISHEDRNRDQDEIVVEEEITGPAKDHHYRVVEPEDVADAAHTDFIEMHDPKHRHPRFYDHHHQGSPNKCLSPTDMIKMLNLRHRHFAYKVGDSRHRRNQRHVHMHQYDGADDANDADGTMDEDAEASAVHDITITPVDFVDVLCPALLTQIEKRQCATATARTLSSEGGDVRSERKLFQFAWLYASISIGIISMCGLFGVALVPLTKSKSYAEVLRFLVALAIGTLAGDALMHLLPHALAPHLDHGDDTLPVSRAAGASGPDTDEPVFLCACAFGAALFMYTLETLLPVLYNGMGGGGGGHGHAHHHHHHHHQHRRRSSTGSRRESVVAEELTLEPDRKMADREADLDLSVDAKKPKMEQRLTAVALMVIIGDGLHNITDGLAIGAAFALDPITGMATALAVLCHELPHELGDFALLLKTGVSIKRALIFNIISSVLSLIGMAVGLFIAGIHTSVVRWIYAGTAGTFLYIALADLVPELGKDVDQPTVKGILVQVCGILMGGLIMLAIALNEDRLRMLFE